MLETEYKLHQGIKFWNIIFTIFFLFLNFAFFVVLLGSESINFELTAFDIILLSLAVWRIVRLFVYDNITLFLRELFMDLKVEEGKYLFVESGNSFKRTIYKLLLCPWCFGVWSASILTFLYILLPELKVFYFILAISVLGSFLQIISNLVGWSAEYKKSLVNKS